MYAYVVKPGAMVRLQGHRLHVTFKEQTLEKWPGRQITGLVLCGRTHISSSAVHALLRQGVCISLVSRSGFVRGRILSQTHGRIDRRLAQFQAATDPRRAAALASQVVRSKIQAMMDVIQQQAGDNARLAYEETLRSLHQRQKSLKEGLEPARLLGIEGEASRQYWSCFGQMLQPSEKFSGRRRRPAGDPVNAALGMGYALLAAEVGLLLENSGLDPYLGFYHTPKNHRPGLVCDVMEPLRHPIVDRLVLRAFNRQQIRMEHFEPGANASVRFTEVGLRLWIDLWEHWIAEKPGGYWQRRYPRCGSYRQVIGTHCQAIVQGFSDAGHRSPALPQAA